jgi:hypothetical protein
MKKQLNRVDKRICDDPDTAYGQIVLVEQYGEGRCVLCNSPLSVYNPFAICALCRRDIGGDEESWPRRDATPPSDEAL